MKIKISDAVHCKLAYVTATLGEETFSFEDLKWFTEVERRKSLLFEKEALPLSVLGFTKAFIDKDLVVIRAGMDEALTQIALLHEIAHLLLDHPQASSQTYKEWVLSGRKQEELDIKRTYNNEDMYRENDAEALATLLWGYIVRQETTLPEIAKDIYGWKHSH